MGLAGQVEINDDPPFFPLPMYSLRQVLNYYPLPHLSGEHRPSWVTWNSSFSSFSRASSSMRASRICSLRRAYPHKNSNTVSLFCIWQLFSAAQRSPRSILFRGKAREAYYCSPASLKKGSTESMEMLQHVPPNGMRMFFHLPLSVRVHPYSRK